MGSRKKDIDRLSNEQLSGLFAPVPRLETGWGESRQRAGLVIIGLPALVLVIWFLFT